MQQAAGVPRSSCEPLRRQTGDTGSRSVKRSREPTDTGEVPRTVLVCDDEEVLRVLMRAALDPLGHEIVEARDGDESLELARTVRPDLIVLDMMMPVLNGVDALPAIVRGSPDSKVVVYSAFTDDPAIERIYDAGAHAVVNKAAPVDQLFLAMSGLLRRNSS